MTTPKPYNPNHVTPREELNRRERVLVISPRDFSIVRIQEWRAAFRLPLDAMVLVDARLDSGSVYCGEALNLLANRWQDQELITMSLDGDARTPLWEPT